LHTCIGNVFELAEPRFRGDIECDFCMRIFVVVTETAIENVISA